MAGNDPRRQGEYLVRKLKQICAPFSCPLPFHGAHGTPGLVRSLPLRPGFLDGPGPGSQMPYLLLQGRSYQQGNTFARRFKRVLREGSVKVNYLQSDITLLVT